MTYSTTESYEAAYLLSQGHKLIDASYKDNSKFVTFDFEEIDNIDDVMLDFQNKSEIQSFIQGFEQVKKMIKREQDKRRGTEQRSSYGYSIRTSSKE